jgi:hypothetical protein
MKKFVSAGIMSLVAFTLMAQSSTAKAGLLSVKDTCHLDRGNEIHSFQIRYLNPTFPTGSQAELIYGLKSEGCFSDENGRNGECKTYDWDSPVFTNSAIVSNLPDFVAQIVSPSGSSGGHFLAIQFVLKITQPDGKIIWENANSNYGYYEVNFLNICPGAAEVAVQSIQK